MNVETASAVRPLTAGMRRMLLVASGLVFIVGIQLYILSGATEHFFAWTITPPLSAAFMGAAYWSSCVLEFMSARETAWARARVGVPAVLLFTTLTLILTLMHIEIFHLDVQGFAWYTVALTWVWIAVYAIVPLLLVALLVPQLRAPGGDPPRRHPLLLWLRGILVLQALVMLLVGGALLFAPAAVAPGWPWMLTPVVARVIGAWLLGLGVASAHMVREHDYLRIYPALLSMIVFAVLQFVALARYPAEIQWEAPQAWAYLGLLAVILVAGLAGTWQARRAAAATSS